MANRRLAARQSNMQIFGNSLACVRGFCYFTGILFVFLFVVFFAANGRDADLFSRSLLPLLISAAIAAIPLLAILPTCAFALHVDGRVVRHVFLGRFVLSERALDELRSVRIATGCWAAVLRFEHAKTIRFFGAGLDELDRLCTHLEERRPAQVSFSK